MDYFWTCISPSVLTDPFLNLSLAPWYYTIEAVLQEDVDTDFQRRRPMKFHLKEV